MTKFVCLVVLWFLIGTVTHADEQTDSSESRDYNFLKNTLHAVTRQVMLQQFYAEEKIRSDGSSGLKQVRVRKGGMKNYYAGSFSGGSAAAIHNHANNIRTVGMGEFIAVLNGIEFRTRHNDYRLYMPHRTSTEYGAREPVPFPDVPPQVLAKDTVQDQVDEMREYFKAWGSQNVTHRDYREYFRAILCYLEGSWTKPGEKIDEPFHSDRHFIDAKNWFDLMDKIRFTSYTGGKSLLENLSFLPTKIMGFVNETLPLFAQWNYRIMCHPLKDHLPTKRLRVVEDFRTRLSTKRHILHHIGSRGARFQLNSKDQDVFDERPAEYELLDKLMEEIPGKNNYKGHLNDSGFDANILNFDGSGVKDVSRYHRWFKLGGKDAMGLSRAHRGFADSYMFSAMTTQDKVAGMTYSKCKKRKRKGKVIETCEHTTQKWTFAIPLEIIYLTPLNKWNPYNIPYRGDYKSGGGKIATQGGRNGGCDNEAQALNGTHSKFYYLTPSSFFGAEVAPDAADTTKGMACVLDKDGNVRVVRASGTRITLPTIKGVGVLRTRYPIFPVHGEGSGVWKEVNALRDVVMDEAKKKLMEWSKNAPAPTETILQMSESRSTKVPNHTHYVTLAPYQMKDLESGYYVTVETTEREGHSHTLVLMMKPDTKSIYYTKCTGRKLCRDSHGRELTVAEDSQNA